MAADRRRVELVYEVPSGDETRRKISEIAAASDRVSKSLDAMERKYDGVAKANAIFNREQEKLNALLASGHADATKATKILNDMTAARDRAIVTAQKLQAVQADPQAEFNAQAQAALNLEHSYDGVARATHSFSETQKQLQQWLAAGVIDQQKYTKVLNDATAARDRAIVAAQKQMGIHVDPQADLAAATAAATALEHKYDGVAKATADFAAEQKKLNDWLAAGIIDQQKYTKVLNDATAARDRAIAAAQKQQAANQIDPTAELKAAQAAALALEHRYDGVAKATHAFAEEQLQLNQWLAAGAIDQAKHTKLLNDATAARDRAIVAAQKLAGIHVDPVAELKAAQAAALALEHRFDGVARATHAFSEEQKQLNTWLAAGIIDQQKYTKLINDATAARDRAIATAQKQQAANQVDPQAELKEAQAAALALEHRFDGVARATHAFAEEQRQLNQWLQLGAIDQTKYTKLLDDATAARDRAIAAAQKQQAANQIDPQAGLKAAQAAATALEHKYDQVAKAASVFAEEERQLNTWLQTGIIDRDRYNRMLANSQGAYQAAVEAANKAAAAQNGLSGSTNANTNAALNNYYAWQRKQILQSAAINTFQSLVAGQNLMTVAMVQGSQAAGVFAAQLGRFALMAGPVLAVAAAVGYIGYAAARAEGEMRAYTVRLQAMGNQAGTTAQQLRDLQRELMAGGASRADAISATMNLASSRTLNGNLLPQVAKLGQDYSAAFGKSFVEGSKELQNALESGLPGILQLDEKIGFLTKTEREAVHVMAEHGDKAGVLNTALAALDRQIGGLNEKSLSDTEKAFNNIGAAWDDFIEAIAASQPAISTINWISDKLSGIAGWIRGPQTQVDVEAEIQKASDKWFELNQKIVEARKGTNYAMIADLELQAQETLDQINKLNDMHQGMPDLRNPPPNDKPKSDPGNAFVEEEERRQKQLAAAISVTARTREIETATLNARREAANKNLDALQTERLIRTRVAEVIATQGAAYTDQIALTDAQTQASNDLAAAWQNGASEAERQIALNEALALSAKNVTVNVEAETQRILLRNAAASKADFEKTIDGYTRTVEAQERVAEATGKGSYEAAEAARQNQVMAATYEMLAKAYATRSPEIIAAAEAQAEAYDKLSQRAADAGAKQFYNTGIKNQERQLKLIQQEFGLLGATNEQRAVAIARERAINELKVYGNKLSDEQRQKYIANAEAIARQEAMLQQVQEISDEITDELLDGFWDARKGLEEFGEFAIDILKKIAEEAYIRPVIEPMINQAVGAAMGAPGSENHPLAQAAAWFTKAGGNLGFATGGAQAAPDAEFVGPMPLTDGAKAGSMFPTTTMGQFVGSVGVGYGTGTMAASLVGGPSEKGGQVGAAAGAVAGAVIGSVIPVVGTMLGAAIGGALGGAGGSFIGRDPKKDKEAQANTAKFDEIGKAITAFNRLGAEVETNTGKAMRELTETFYQLKAEAEKLKRPIDDIQEAFRRAKEELTKEFNEGIAAEIAQLTGDARLGYDQLRKAQAQQVREAIDAEGDLEQVRKLHALQIDKYFSQLTADQLAAMGSLASAVDQLKLKIFQLTSDLNDAVAKQMNLVREGARQAEEAAKFYQGVSDTLRQTAKDIKSGPLSIYSPLTKLNDYRSQFETLYAAAIRGDKEAIAEIGGVGQQFLQFSRDYNASSDWYTADFMRVTNALQELGVKADTEAAAQERRAQLLELEYVVLQAIQNELAKPDPNTDFIKQQLETLGIIDQSLQGGNNLSVAQLQQMVGISTGDLSIVDAIYDGNASLTDAIFSGNNTIANLLREMLGKQAEQKAAAAQEAARVAKLDALAASARQSANTYANQIGGVRNVGAAEKMSANDQIFNLASGAKSYEGGKNPGSMADRSNAMRSIMVGLVNSLLRITGGAGPTDATISMKDKYGSGYRIGNVNKMEAYGINDTQGIITGFLADYVRQMVGIEQTLLDFMQSISFANIPSAFEQIARRAAEIRGYSSGTYSAHPGMAVVGENGPELMRFKGGERVWSAVQSQKMMANDNSDVVEAIIGTTESRNQATAEGTAAILQLRSEQAAMRRELRDLNINLQRIAKRA